MTAAPLAEETAAVRRFPVLDTVRAVGALAVLTTHTSFQSGAYGWGGAWGTLLARLDVGVAVFFVLSGFLLSRPYVLARLHGGSAPDVRRYYRKRVARIYPVYAVTVVVALLLVEQRGPTTWLDWVRTLLLLDTYTADELPQGLTQMWSLAAEVAFYVVLPWLLVAAFGRAGAPARPLDLSRAAAVLGALTAVSVVWHLGVDVWLDERVTGIPTTWLPAYLTWFVLGILLAVAQVATEDGGGRRAVPRWAAAAAALGRMPGLCWSFVAALMLVSATPLAGPALLEAHTPAESLTKHLLYAAVGTLVVLTGVFAAPHGRYTAVMATPALRHLGVISYSTFCIHLTVLHLVMAVGGFELFRADGLVVWSWTLAGSLVASELLYRCVEVPGMRLANGRRRGARSATQPASAETQNSTR